MKSRENARQRGIARMAAAIVGATVLLGLAAWGAYVLTTPSVTVVRMTRGPVVEAFYATGTVQPSHEFPIKSATEGFLERVYVDKGDRIKAGQVLAVVNNGSIAYAVARAAAEVEEKTRRADASTSPVLKEYDERIRNANERRQIAQREVDRMQEMAKTSAAAGTDIDRSVDRVKLIDSEIIAAEKQRDAKVLELARELQTAKSAFDTANWEKDQQTLRAPVDGVVLDRPTSQGTRVGVNDIIMRTADVTPENLVMRAQVDEEDVTHCYAGQTVRMSLYAFAGERITGKVKQIYDEADRDRRTFEVDVVLDQPKSKLAAGMTGELAFVIDELSAADILPSAANQQGSVYVVRDGRVRSTGAILGLKSVESVEVKSGLTADDRVIVSPIGTIKVDGRVRAIEVEPGVIEKQARDAAATEQVSKKPF